MIAHELLRVTEGRAPGICVYGSTGMQKTGSIATLPPPILMFDTGEGGSPRILPWIRRRRRFGETTWTEYSNEDRQHALSLLDERYKGLSLKPYPAVDVIHYDNLDYASFLHMTEDIGNFDVKAYNSLALDSLQEFSVITQTFSKGPGNSLLGMNEAGVPAFAWVRAQERAMIMLRKLRNYRDTGIVVYFTASEDISKDYVKNPMEKRERGHSCWTAMVMSSSLVLVVLISY